MLERLEEERLDEERLDERTLDRLEDDKLDDDKLDVDERTDDEEATLDFTDDAEEALPPQILPVTSGVSTAPLVFTCTPKDAICPGCRFPFQLKLVAL